MITVALDEQGDFENLNNKLNSEPVFIGGVLYDDCGDSNDFDTEKRRLQSYLRNVCSDAGGVYPKDLHFASEGGTNNSHIVKEVKTVFGNTIKEFLEEGTWRNYDLGFAPRRGKYYIFASLRGENGKAELLAKSVSEAVREDFASNLYLHMAEDVVERMLFHNPIANAYEDKIRGFVDHSEGIIRNIAESSLRECGCPVNQDDSVADGRFTYMYT